jgi:hypothetical protein
MKPSDMSTDDGFFANLTLPGRASFDWALLFAGIALVFPVSGVIGMCFAYRARRKGYPRWAAGMAMAVWCMALGVIVRTMLHLAVFP